LLERLAAVDALLNRRFEVLDAHTHAVETESGQRPDLLLAGDRGVNLDRGLDAPGPGKPPLDRVREAGELSRGEIGRGGAAEMNLDHLGPRGDQRGDLVELQLQRPDVSLDERLAPGHEHVAAAVVTELPAERDVDIQGGRARSGAPERRPSLGFAEVGLP